MATADGDIVKPNSACDQLDEKPERSQTCQAQSCPTKWYHGSWSKVSTQLVIFSCFYSFESFMVIWVHEIRNFSELIPTPVTFQCSQKCGRGYRSREVYCKSGDVRVRSSQCDRKSRPKLKERCRIKKCKRKRVYAWFTTNWSECSVTCGSGTQFRENKCTYKTKNGRLHPAKARKCRKTPFPKIPLEKSCTQVPCRAQLMHHRVPGTLSSRYHPHSTLQGGEAFASPKSLGRMYARWIAGSWQKVNIL